MSYKTTLNYVFSNLRKNRMALLLFFTSLFSLVAFQSQAQTLITGSQLVGLDACADYKEFSVKIGKGATECTNGTLNFVIPPGFALDTNTVKVDGNNAVMNSVTVNGGEIKLPTITAGSITEEMVITFKVKALCEVIGKPADGNVIQYTFSGCGVDQPDTSEAINVIHAVLRVSVSPSPILGNVGDEVERTITIINQGAGAISEIYLARILGDGLEHLTYGVVDGWAVDTSDSNKLVFTGNTLKSGGTISFTEKVNIVACELSATDYEVYYGCSEKCTNSGVNGTTKSIINIKAANAPQLEVKANTSVAACFNGYVPQTWTITNKGGTATSVIEFEIGTNELGGNINPNTIKINGSSAPVIGTPGNEPKNVKISISALEPGESVVITFDQYISAPESTQANCTTAPTSFTNNGNYFNASYTFSGACAPVLANGSVTAEATYSFDGKNIGEIDITTGEAFEADFLFKNFKIPAAGLAVGDTFSVIISLSPDLSISDATAIAMTLGGFPVVAVPTGSDSEYKLTFMYGTAPWDLNTDLNLSTARLKFPLELSCPMMSDLWYRVGGELNKKDAANSPCTSIVFKCNETKLNGYCDAGPCTNGLQNHAASLKRVSLGYAVDGPGIPTVGTIANSNDVQIRTFIAGDLLEISQSSTVVMQAGEVFTTIRMVVAKDNNVLAYFENNTGKVVVTRNGTPHTFSNLVVQENAGSFIVEFSVSNEAALNNVLLDNDTVTLSLQIKANEVSEEFVQFPTKSYLIRGNEALACGRDYTATGFYVPVAFNFKAGTVDFVSCEENTNIATFTATVFELDRQDAIFTKEFRKLFKATKATLTVPDYLKMTGVKVVIKNQPWLGINNVATISGLAVSNGAYIVDLATILNAITNTALFDEGFVIEIVPTVVLLGCEPTITAKELQVAIKLEGVVYDGAGVESPFTETQALKYNTGIGSLKLSLTNGAELGTLSPDGTEVSWIVKLESEGKRNFNSVWISKDSGALGIETIIPVSGFDGSNEGAAISPENGLYKLGNFGGGGSQFYKITSKIIDCKVEELTLVAGYNCAPDTYPANNAEGCGLAKYTLTHKDLEDDLQTSIVDASNQNDKQDFCKELWYTIEIHNGGDTQVDELKVRIPLHTAPGLVFDRFEFSNVFNVTDLNPTVTFTAGTNFIVSNDTLNLSLPNTVKLNTLDRVQVKVFFDINGCDFRSGAKLGFTGLGTNICGAELAEADLAPATSKRILIEGGSDSFPELETITHKVVLDPVLTVGGNLRAKYNFELLNTGADKNTDAITDEYYFAIKLPVGWSIVGNPQDYIQPAGKVEYKGIDQLDNRGYIYKVTQDISVDERIKLVNVPLKYTVNDEVSLTCNHDFGKIAVMVFQNIDVSSCNTPSCPKGIDQVLLEDLIPMILPVDGVLTIDPPQQTRIICNPSLDGKVPTLEDVTFTNGFYLSWYENEQEAIADKVNTRLPLNTPLVDGRTYYVINRFIADGACKSNIGEIKVLLNNEVLIGTTDLICSIDQQTYNIVVELTGKGPYLVSGTGAPGSFNGDVWTSDTIAKGTAYSLIFTDANNCTPLVIEGEAPVCCTLQIECPSDITITSCEQGYGPEITGIPTILTSCGATTYTYSDSQISVCIAGVRSFARTFIVTDVSGVEVECEQIITIEDKVTPVLNRKPQSITVSCESNTTEALESWLRNHGGAVATDACGVVVWTNNFDTISFDALCGEKAGSYTVTFTATDACGNEVSEIATFTIEDKTPPTITKVAEGLTLECKSANYQQLLDAWLGSNGGATATDGCSNDVDLEWDHDFTVVTQGSCPGTGSALVTFTVTDPCGNKATTVATFTVVDTTAPTFTKKPKSKIVECDGKGNLDGPDGFHAWLADHGGAEAADSCGIVTWSTTHIEDTNTICGITGTVIVDFIVTDACGNMAFEQATFAIKDTKAPIIEKPASHLEIECGVHVEDELNAWLSNFGGAVATDNCGEVTWTHNYAGKLTVCGAPIEVTFTATDACNNKSVTMATVKVVDTIVPTITKEAQDLTVECNSNTELAFTNWLKNHGGAEAIDSCSIVTWTNDSETVDFISTCGKAGSYTVTFTATDACSRKIATTATFTVVDTEAPKFVGVLPVTKMTVSCDVVPATPILVATDNCGEAVISFTEKRVGGLCANSYDLVRVWTATDSCGNATSFTQTITVEDKVAPKFDQTDLPANNTVSCLNDVPTVEVLTAEDNCGTADVVFKETQVDGTCANSFVLTRIWTATDLCGNSVSHTQVITVEDKIAPTFVEDLPANITVSCLNDVPVAAALTAKDNCGTADVEFKETKVAGTCVNSFVLTRIWTATDECGNSISHTQIVTVEDKIAPKFVEVLPSNITVSCLNDVPVAAALTAKDNCGTADVEFKETKVDGTCANNFVVKRTWTATDLCGNTTSHTQIIIVADKLAPVFDVVPQDVTVECDGTGNKADFQNWLTNFGNAVATDNCSADDKLGWNTEIVNKSVLCGKTGNTVVKFTVTDECGNASSKQATFTIKDEMAPSIDKPADNLVIECGTNVDTQITTWLNNRGGAIASDLCGSVTWTNNYTGLTAACGNTGNATVVFTATDSCGNTEVTSATIKVVDTLKPTLVKEAQGLTVQCGTTTQQALDNWLANHAGAEATDSCSTVKWTNDYVPANFVTTCGNAGSVKVIFKATDACGNEITTTATFTVVDTEAPKFVGTLPVAKMTVSCDVVPATPILVATDNCGEAVISFTEKKVGGLCANSYDLVRVWTATDSCGNVTSFTQTITVEDKTAPEFTKSPDDVIVECDGAGNIKAYKDWLATFGNAVASDNCSAADKLVWTTEVVNTSVLCGKTGNTVVKFTVTDECGNTSSKQATFTIVDTIGPDFIVEAIDTTVACDGNGNANDLAAWLANHGGAKAIDACSNTVTWTNNFTGLVKACGSTGTATVIFTATDSCGNESETTATFTIVDDVAPVFTTNLPKDLTLECTAGIPEAAVMNAVDACSTAKIEFTELRTNGDCLGSYQLVRTWTATDSCGNTASHVQKITIEDTTAPVFVDPLPAKELFLSCEDLKEREQLKAIDSCGTVNVTFTEETIAGDCPNRYDLLRTWTATDSCGNETEFEQTIHVACKIEFTNAISANGDGVNDEFQLKGIECYPGNTVEIFNRWGKLVYTTTNYNSNGNVFKGYANTKHVVSGGEKLPTGTYFYVVKYDFSLGNGTTQTMDQSGYIHLESN
ncbi:gliding motility-associated C-terminal domain-containing protein [Myroides guanonis]|uniref:Gliding motility-associated C-terminal domain-containing protein n=1 Tax=Myroides guanonis TaxID=1150112 RepID=A0A1I3THL9_9FLAO|nr:gliding motility-associated C-terminal domain-containing protein [Myroides guanonis]SFJ69121.1 gliding motility-associated C-terminal domain-containing protein [Myroides guanonis]